MHAAAGKLNYTGLSCQSQFNQIYCALLLRNRFSKEREYSRQERIFETLPESSNNSRIVACSYVSLVPYVTYLSGWSIYGRSYPILGFHANYIA